MTQNRFKNLLELLETITPHSAEIKKYLLIKKNYDKTFTKKENSIENVVKIKNDTVKVLSEKNLITNNEETKNQILQTFLEENTNTNLDIEIILKKLDEIENEINNIKNDNKIIDIIEKEKNKVIINKNLKEEIVLKDKEEIVLKDKEKQKKDVLITEKNFLKESEFLNEKQVKEEIKNKNQEKEKLNNIEKEINNDEKENIEKEKNNEKNEDLDENIETRKKQGNVDNNTNIIDKIILNQNKSQESKDVLKVNDIKNFISAKEKITEFENKTKEIQRLIDQIISTGGVVPLSLLSELENINAQKSDLNSTINIIPGNKLF